MEIDQQPPPPPEPETNPNPREALTLAQKRPGSLPPSPERSKRVCKVPTVPVCPDFLRRQCHLSPFQCTFAHPPPSVDVEHDKVIVCCAFLWNVCLLGGTCRYLHPPPHIHAALLREMEMDYQKPGQMHGDFLHGNCFRSEHHSVASKNAIRLEEIYLLDPSSNSSLMEIVEKEAEQGTVRKADSCSRAILWLSRSLDFSVALLQGLEKDSEQSLNQIIEEAYKTTLGPWHGWIASDAYKIALQLTPDREVFVGLLMGKDKDNAKFKGEIYELATMIQPFLDEVNELMNKHHLERLKST